MTKKQSFLLVTIALIVLTAIIFLLLFFSLFKVINNRQIYNKANQINNIKISAAKTDPLITPASKIYKSFIRSSDPIRGESNSQLTILEFGDFECPYCAQIYPNLTKLLDEYQGQVKLVWKDFVNPIHPHARQAAMAARCAADQGKFWVYHDLLFENQDNLSRQLYNQIATNLNLDLKKFNNCLDQQNKIKLIGQGLDDGQRLGVDATPYLFIGSNKINFAVSYDELKKVVDYELTH